jgi:hypothetical protein
MIDLERKYQEMQQIRDEHPELEGKFRELDELRLELALERAERFFWCEFVPLLDEQGADLDQALIDFMNLLRFSHVPTSDAKH